MAKPRRRAQTPVRDLEIYCPTGHTGVVVYDGDGNLRGRIDLCVPATERDWDTELAEARASVVALRWWKTALATWNETAEHPEGTGESERHRREAWAEGLRLGLMGAEHSSIPGRPPESIKIKAHRAYSQGWSLGRGMVRACDYATQEVS